MPKAAIPVPKQSVQVISRAISVLRALEGEPAGLSLGQIGERVGLARSTVQRIVEALRGEQFVISASPTSGVRLGPALIRLAASASVEFDHITRPIIATLSQTLGETVDVSVLKGSMAVFTDQIQGSHRLRAVSAVGESFPLHCTANGKALLSVLRDQLSSQSVAVEYVAAEGLDVTIEANQTIIKSQLQAWIDHIETVGE